MNSRELLSTLGEQLGWTVLHSLWQGAAIAIVLAITLAMLRHRAAAARHAACLLALVACLITSVVTAMWLPSRQLPTPLAPPSPLVANPPSTQPGPQPKPTVMAWSPLREVESSDLAAAAPNPPTPPVAPWQDRLRPYLPWVAAGWLCGVVLLSMRHLGGWFRIRSWRRHSEDADALTASLFTQLQIQFRLQGKVWLRQSATVLAPMLAGVLRPVVILPARLLTGLSAQELQAVLAHELAHLARRDTWSNLLQVIIETIFFYHPALWWISHRTRVEREHAADDLALRVCSDRRQYADALARLAELQSAPSMALAANGGSLLQRIRRIILPTPREPATPGWTLPTLAASVVLLITLLVRATADDPKVIVVKPGESVQKAIDAAPAGAIVRLGDGRWRERIVVSKPMTIEGAGWEKTSLWPEQPDPETTKRRAALEERIKRIRNPKEQSEIYRETGTIDEPTIRITAPEGVIIRKVAIRGVTYSDRSVKQSLYSDTLVRFEKAKATITDCALMDYYRGIDVAEGSEATIHRTLIAAMWSQGAYVHPNAKLNFSESEARNCCYAGIVLGRGSGASVIEKSRISGAAWHGIRYDDCAPLIHGNVFFGNARTDIYASGKTAATVHGNLFLGTGIWALLGNRDTIAENTFVGPDAGLGVSGGAAPQVVRNIFANQATAIESTKVNSRDPIAESFGAPSLEGNIFWNVKASFLIDNKPEPLPPGNTEADPKFVDPAKRNYALAADSPARAAKAGALEVLSPSGPWPLLAEEKAIIPDGDTRDVEKWKAPNQPQQANTARFDLFQKAREASNAWVADALQLDDESKRTAAVAAIRAAVESDDPERIRAGLSGFQRIGQIAFDKPAFRPVFRRLLKHEESDLRSTACSVLATTGKSDEDVALVIPLTEDADYEVKKAAVWSLKWLSGGDFTSDAGRAIQKLLERGDAKLNNELWGTMWGTRVSPEIERIIVEASRKDDRGTGYSDVFYHALSVHTSKREPTVTRLIELLASEDSHNVGGRVLWGLQQGVEPDQRPRVADAAMKVIATREDGYMRREAFDCLRMYGTKANAETLRAFLAKPGVTGDLKVECEKTLAMIEQRP